MLIKRSNLLVRDSAPEHQAAATLTRPNQISFKSRFFDMIAITFKPDYLQHFLFFQHPIHDVYTESLKLAF